MDFNPESGFVTNTRIQFLMSLITCRRLLIAVSIKTAW